MRLSPLGKVELDSTRCTGCGLCSIECSSEALITLSNEENDGFKLIFKHGDCTACGRCVEICPEKCLQMKRTFEPDKMKNQSVLFQDNLVRCSECGSPIGPKSMVDKMYAKVTTGGQAMPMKFKLCPECKIRYQFSQLRM